MKAINIDIEKTAWRKIVRWTIYPSELFLNLPSLRLLEYKTDRLSMRYLMD